MTISDKIPTYNLKAVVRETGLKPDTLRAWERRYGLPNPHRTASGYRLYSQRDIDILLWLIDRQNEGMSISRAVALWHRLEDEGNDPISTPVSTTISPISLTGARTGDRQDVGGGTAVVSGGSQPNRVSSIRDAWLSACLSFDEQGSEQLLNQAFAMFHPETVCTELLQQGMSQIGQGWQQGRITVQQEHFASSLIHRRLQSLWASAPSPTQTGRILIGCPATEEHTFVPLLLSWLLRRRGWDVIYLGANVPIDSLETTLTTTNADLVIFVAQQLVTSANIIEIAKLFHTWRVPLGYGGRVFNRLSDVQKIIPGYFLGDKIEPAIQAMEQIMTSPRTRAATHTVTPESHEALTHYQQRRTRIETDVESYLEQNDVDIPPTYLAQAHYHFGNNIEAALKLGSIYHLEFEKDFVENLLLHHAQIPSVVFNRYLYAYLSAAGKHLDAQGKPIYQWLSQRVE